MDRAVIAVMAGLPATGKSTLAHAIASRLDGVVLGKDEVRAAAFPEAVRNYTEAQDDLAMEMVYQAVSYVHREFPGKRIVIDGRTFSKRQHVERCLTVMQALSAPAKWIECVCDDEIARERLAHSHASAGNRDFALYLRLTRERDPLELERLVLDTGKLSQEEAVTRALNYLLPSRGR